MTRPQQDKKILVISALQCEAAPLIKAWGAKPLREHPCAERFQVFHTDRVFIATSGVGKVRAAIATASLLTGLFINNGEPPPLVVNIGISGSSDGDLPIGSLTYINKVTDIATNTRFYPDIVIRHGVVESALQTYDHPVTTPPTEPVTVDMEGAGFIQAATTVVAPSSICILKVISDRCLGERLTKEQASGFIAQHADSVQVLLRAIIQGLPEPAQLSLDDRALLRNAFAHATLSLSQRIELERRILALQAQGVQWSEAIELFVKTPIATKEARNAAFAALLSDLAKEVAL
jgi:adenosylhomocysteine nucleosidase